MAFDNIVSQEADEYTVTISTELNGRTVTQTVEKFPMGSQEEDEEAKEMEVHEDGGGGDGPDLASSSTCSSAAPGFLSFSFCFSLSFWFFGWLFS